MEQKKITLPQGWEIDKVEGNEIILKESKKEFPETWEECVETLDKTEYFFGNSIKFRVESTSLCKTVLPIGLGKPMLALCQLLVCREVYRNGWKPNWSDSVEKYCIKNFDGKLDKEGICHSAHVLSFQSAEVRDKFLENFRDLIEEAKELI